MPCGRPPTHASRRRPPALEHLGDQLERRLRRCAFEGGLTRLRSEGCFRERLLPLAVVAARIEGVEPDAIAEGCELDGTEVRRILRARSWRAVWRFDVRDGADGSWTPMRHPWRGTDAVTDRSAEAVAAELTDAFLHSPDRPPPSVPWRIAVWWEEEDRPRDGGAGSDRVGPATACRHPPRENMHKAPPTIGPVQTPLAYIAQRWTPTPQTVRRAALSAVVMSVVIIVTGGAVRLTGSGLGCDTWPKCTDDSLFATPEQGIHGAIEFGNRMLTYVLSAAVGWAIVAASAAKPGRRGLSRLGLVAVLDRHGQRRPRRHHRLGGPQPLDRGRALPARHRAAHGRHGHLAARPARGTAQRARASRARCASCPGRSSPPPCC